MFAQDPLGVVYYLANTSGWATTYGGLPTGSLFPGNLVVNGNFETDNFSGWTVSGFGYNNNISTVAPHSGLYAALFSKVSSGLASTTLSQTIAAEPGGTYTLSLWVNGYANGGELVDWSNDILINQAFGSGWTHLQFTVNASGSSSVLKFVTAYTTTAVDDISVVAVGYNQIASQSLGGAVRLSFMGDANTSYALDWTFNLLPPS